MNVSARDLLWRRGATDPTTVLHSVFETVAYADVFDFPLTASEVYRYLTSTKASVEEISRALANEDLFARVGEYFTLRGREGIIATRERREKVAARLWTKARRYGRILAFLPFVRMVAVTGSLAMNNTDEGKDVDFMMVTSPNRLWTCRALTLLVARIAKLEGVHLCPNYLVTTNALQLNERSLYVAHELVQMIPLSGMEIYEEILRLNNWVFEFLPNAASLSEVSPRYRQRHKPSSLQKLLELFFSFPIGDWLETWEMKRKISRLSREQSSSFESYFSADVCKGHIDRHGENLVTALAVRLQKTV